ncbi:hypothetical protein [Flagellimonas sp.]|uniref:hypothetical protein n=1 Tax=Flagellimonas sp. TaxID=2058762 RepID=UPI003B5AA625
MERSYWINPFTRIAGFKSLVLGFMAMLLVAYLSFGSGTHFYGFSNIDFAKDSGFKFFFLEHLISWLVISLLLYASGLMLSKTRIRIIDVFGTALLARIPLIIVPLIRYIPYFKSFVVESVAMYVVTLIYLLSLSWTIVLLFHGFKVSSNLRGTTLTITFICSLVISEIITRLILNTIPLL